MFLRIFTYLAFILSPFCSEAVIFESTSVTNIIPLIDEQSWIVIDLDNTTFEGKQALGHTDWFYDKAHALMKEGMTLDEATRECYPEWINVQKICPVKPVEDAFISALKIYQSLGYVVMGLTHRQPSIADSTLRQLDSIGLDLSESAPDKSTLIVPSDTPTLYDQGVLFTGEFNKKGVIFVRFLSQINQKPLKVVFIDDKKNHVEEVGRALEAEGIEFVGVHYRANEYLPKVYKREVAEFQRKFMHTIMSNEAAQLLMEHGLE
jgi:hypothetical protein